MHSQNESFSVDDIWDGESVNSGLVSKWVASKLKSIAATVGVAFSGYENEVIQLLSKIEKSSFGGGVVKQSTYRPPPANRRQRELKRLEFGVNYDWNNASSSGMMDPYV